MNLELDLKTKETYYEQPAELGEGSAYHLYVSPEKADEVIATQIGKLDTYYDLLRSDANPLALEHAVNRSLVMATGAPLYHLMELEADRRFLDSMKYGQLDVDMYTAETSEYTHPTHLEGEYGRFADITGAVNMEACSAVLTSLEDPDHSYRRVWELFSMFLPEFAKTERQLRGFQRPIDPTEAITQVFAQLGGDTILPLLVQTVFHFHDDLGLRGQAITRKLFYHLEELSWTTRKKRNFLGANFPDAITQEETSSSCPFKPTGKSTFNSNEWGDASLLWPRGDVMGFSEIPGFCPAAVDLASPSLEPQLVVEAMHELASPYIRPRLLERLPGTSTAGELSLIRSIFLLDRTLIKSLGE